MHAKENISAGLWAARKNPQLFTFERGGCHSYKKGNRGEAGLGAFLATAECLGLAIAASPRFKSLLIQVTAV